MGRIPEFKRRNIRQFQDTNAIEAKLAMGRQIDRALTTGFNAYHQIQRADANDWTAKNLASYQADAQAVREQHRQEFQGNPADSWSNLDGKLRELDQQYLSEAPNSYAESAFKRNTDILKERERGSNTLWEGQQITLNTQNTAREHVETQAMNAYRSADPSTIDALVTEDTPAMQNLKTYARPDVYAKTVAALKNNAAMSAFEGMIDKGDIGGAESLLSSKKFDDSLGVNGVVSVQRKIDREKAFQAREANQLTKLKTKDPYGYMVKIGDTQGLEMLDPSNLVGAEDAPIKEYFKQRLDYIDSANSKHGVKLPLFHNQEKEFLSNSIQKLDPRQGTMVMSKLSTGMGEKHYNELSASIFEKNPAMGVAMSVVNDSDEGAYEALHILKGQKLLKNEATNIDEQSIRTVREVYNSHLAGLIEDPEARDMTFEAVKAASVSKMFDKNISPDKAGEVVKETLNNLIGEPAEINGFKTLPHRMKNGKYASQDWMEDSLDKLSSAKMMEKFGDVPRTIDGNPIDEDEWQTGMFDSSSYHPVMVNVEGKRKYKLVNARGENAVDSKGNMFLIDFSKVES